MRRFLPFRSLFAALALFAAVVSVHAEGGSERTGIAMHGQPALPERFGHFPYANPKAPRQGRIVLAKTETFDSLNPYIVIGSAPDTVRFVLQSLMIRSLDEPFSLYALIARSVEMPDDRSEVTFNLDPRARFSDGKPLTAEDVRFSFDLLAKHGKPLHRASFAQVRAVEVLSPQRIRFNLSGSADRELPFIIAMMPIFAAHATDPATFADPTLKPIIGSGPYAFDEIRPGERIVLKRRGDYWGEDLPVTKGLYNFNEIVYLFYRDANTMFEVFKGGQYNFRQEESPTRWVRGYDFEALRSGAVRKESLLLRSPQGMTGFVFNTRREIFADIRVRQALASLFDFQWVNRNLYYGLQVRSESYFNNSDLSSLGHPANANERKLLSTLAIDIPQNLLEGTWRLPESTTMGEIDREAARKALALLNDAGWELNGKTLRRKTDGTPFRFEIMVRTAEQERLAMNYRMSLERFGIDARVRRIDDMQYWRRLGSFDYDMFQNTWQATTSPGVEQRGRWSSATADSEGSLNYAGVKSPAIDALLERMMSVREQGEFIDIVRALDRVLISGTYVVPLSYINQQWLAYRANLTHPDPAPLLGVPVPIETWWQTTP